MSSSLFLSSLPPPPSHWDPALLDSYFASISFEQFIPLIRTHCLPHFSGDILTDLTLCYNTFHLPLHPSLSPSSPSFPPHEVSISHFPIESFFLLFLHVTLVYCKSIYTLRFINNSLSYKQLLYISGIVNSANVAIIKLHIEENPMDNINIQENIDIHGIFSTLLIPINNTMTVSSSSSPSSTTPSTPSANASPPPSSSSSLASSSSTTTSPLTTLLLPRNRLSGPSLYQILKCFLSPRVVNLTSLDLSYNGMTDDHMKYLCNVLLLNNHLSFINLSYNYLSDTSISHIIHMLSPELIETKEMFKYLKSHQYHTSLPTKNTNNNTTTATTKYFRDPQITLKSLDISHNFITDFGAELLIQWCVEYSNWILMMNKDAERIVAGGAVSGGMGMGMGGVGSASSGTKGKKGKEKEKESLSSPPSLTISLASPSSASSSSSSLLSSSSSPSSVSSSSPPLPSRPPLSPFLPIDFTTFTFLPYEHQNIMASPSNTTEKDKEKERDATLSAHYRVELLQSMGMSNINIHSNIHSHNSVSGQLTTIVPPTPSGSSLSITLTSPSIAMATFSSSSSPTSSASSSSSNAMSSSSSSSSSSDSDIKYGGSLSRIEWINLWGNPIDFSRFTSSSSPSSPPSSSSSSIPLKYDLCKAIVKLSPLQDFGFGRTLEREREREMNSSIKSNAFRFYYDVESYSG